MSNKLHKIRKVIRDIDLYEYLEDHGVKISIRANGEYYYVECWTCGKNKSFIHASNQDPYKGFYRCWTCGAKGNMFDIVARLEHLTIKQAYAKLMSSLEEEYTSVGPILRIELENFGKDQTVHINEPMTLPFNFAPLCKIPQSNYGYRYALGRGITPELMEKFDVRYSPIMQRIIFPVKFRGEMVGWQARAISPEIKPKILSNDGLKKTLVLFNFDNVSCKASIIIVEGIIDAIKANKHNPVALLGKSLSSEQFKLLLRLEHLKKVYIALDEDARENALELAAKLYGIWDIFMVRTSKQKDIGSCTESEVAHLINVSKPYNPMELL